MVAAPPDFRVFAEFDRDASGHLLNAPMTRGLVRRRALVLDPWTDITPNRLRSFRLTYGRSDAFTRIDSATAQVVLDNRDRSLDPLHTGSPYYPNVEPKRRIQLRAQVKDYSGYVMVGAPVGYWPLDETGGTVAADYTEPAQSQDGVLFGSAQLGVTVAPYALAGHSGRVADSAGAGVGTPTITIPASDALALTGTLTIEAWAHPYASINSDQLLIYKPEGYQIGWTADGPGAYPHFGVYVNGAWVLTPTNGGQYDATAWNHLLGTYDGRYLRLYVNGVEVASHALSYQAIVFAPGEVYLFSDGSAGSPFDGAMAHVAIYDRPMSETQVFERYTLGTTGYLNLFTGPAESWSPSWPGLHDGIVTVQAADGFEGLAANTPNPPTYDELIAADKPLVYLPMQDDKGGNSNRNRSVANKGEETDFYATKDGVTAAYPVAPTLESGSGSAATANGQLGFYLEDFAGPLHDTNDRCLRLAYFPISGAGFQAGWLRADFEWFARSSSGYAFTLETWFMHDGFQAFSGVDPIQTFIQKGRMASVFTTYYEEFTFIYTTDGVTPRFEFRLQSNQFPTVVNTFQLPYTLDIGRWYHIACRFDQARLNEMAIFVDGEKVGTHQATGFIVRPNNPLTMVTGTGATYIAYIGRHEAQSDGQGLTTFTNGRFSRWAVYDKGLSDETIAGRYALYTEGLAQNPTGTHAAAVLDETGWPADRRAIDPGVVTAQAITRRGINDLEYLRRLADAEQGAFLIDRNGIAAFQDREHRMTYQRHVVIELTDVEGTSTPWEGTGTTPYQEIVFAFDLRETFNRVTGQRVGAEKPLEIEDEASKRRYHPRTLALPDYVGISDADLLSLMQQRLRELKTPTVRVESAGLLLIDGDDARWPAVLSLSYGDTVLVRRHPGGIGDPIEEAYRVEQYEHAWSYSTYTWTTRLVLSSARYGALWILGDPVYSILSKTTILS